MKKEIYQKILIFTSFILPVILLGIIVFSCYFLPSKVAIHFDMQWNVTRFGYLYEMLILAVALYLIPIIMATIFVNVKAFWTKVIGLGASIVVSIAYFAVLISTLIRIVQNSGNATTPSSGHWVSFALVIIGYILFAISHILIHFKQNIIFKNREVIFTHNLQFNKINIAFSAALFAFGLTVCLGCPLLKNFYSIALFMGALVIYGAIGFFHIKRILNKSAKLTY